MFVAKHTKPNDGRKNLTWLVMGVIGKRGEREEQKLYLGWGRGALLGVKSSHQKIKSSDTW
jgi:hypothetical protein